MLDLSKPHQKGLKSMSAETLEWLNTNVLVGQTDRDGRPWHYAAEYQGQLTNLYPGMIPLEDVRTRLFDWEAEERQLYFQGDIVFDENNEPTTLYMPIDGQKVIVNNKTGATYGLFKDGYRIHQYNEWLIEYVALLLDVSAGDLGISAAGLLRNGGRAWVQVEPAHSRELGGTFVQRFLTATTSHDGTSATKYVKGDNISVCDNTLDWAVKEAVAQFKFKHTKKSADRAAEARQVLDITFAHTDAMDAEIERLMNTTCSDDQFWTMVRAEYPADIQAKTERGAKVAATKLKDVDAKFMRLWHHDNRVSPWKGTAWGAFMAFNTYGQWEQPVRNSVRPERNMLNFLDGKQGESDNHIFELITNTLTPELVG